MPGNEHHDLPPVAAMPDDDRTYLVKSYGALVKPSSAHSITPEMEVVLVPLDKPDASSTIRVNLPDIASVRLGTLWRHRRCLGVHCDTLNPDYDYFEEVTVVGDMSKKPGRIWIHPKNPDRTYFLYDAVLEGADAAGKMVKVMIPCPELLVSTYVPATLHMLTDLVTLPIDEVLSGEVKACSPKRDRYGNCILEVAFEKTRRDSTMLFLAYVHCVEKIKRKVSGIYGGIQAEWHTVGGLTVAPLKAEAWNPGEFRITASGLFDRRHPRLWVQRIERFFLPGECLLVPELPVDPPKNASSRDGDAVPVPAGDVPDDAVLDGEVDPGPEGGRRYVTTGVVVSMPEGIVAKPKRRPATPKKRIAMEGGNGTETVSSGKLSGQERSKDVGVAVYDRKKEKEENGKKDRTHFSVVLEALEKIDGLQDLYVYYLDNDANRFESTAFCTLDEKKGPRCGKAKWCRVGGRNRRLLVAEIVEGMETFYVVDIERKKPAEHYKGMVVRGRTIGPDELSTLRKSLGRNQGKFVKGKGKPAQGGEDTRCPSALLPFNDFKTFVHDMDVDRMVDRILDAIKKKCGPGQEE